LIHFYKSAVYTKIRVHVNIEIEIVA